LGQRCHGFKVNEIAGGFDKEEATEPFGEQAGAAWDGRFSLADRINNFDSVITKWATGVETR
jgi:hypothetical protein